MPLFLFISHRPHLYSCIVRANRDAGRTTLAAKRAAAAAAAAAVANAAGSSAGDDNANNASSSSSSSSAVDIPSKLVATTIKVQFTCSIKEVSLSAKSETKGKLRYKFVIFAFPRIFGVISPYFPP